MAKGGHPTSGLAAIRKAKDERKYGAKRIARTEINRRRKRLKHFKEHPNHIKGVERLRESLGI